MNLTIVLDMYGCPNRCLHCWLGHMPNKKLSDSDAEFVVNYFAPYFDTVTFYSWLREPDFCEDYAARWEKDKLLCKNASPQRFELASFYRIVRDKEYIKFLKEVGTSKVQLTFFGLEEITDKYVGRKGSFSELLRATNLLLDNGITPRWQAFINEENKQEIPLLLNLIKDMRLKERDRDFTFFVHAGSCDGENAKLYDIRLQKENIPPALIPYFIDYENVLTESECVRLLKKETAPYIPELDGNFTLNISNTFDVYYNFTHMTPEWKIGNLKTDTPNFLIDRVTQGTTPALMAASKIPLHELIKCYGNPNSSRIFFLDDYKMYLLNGYLKDTFRLSFKNYFSKNSTRPVSI